MKNNNAREKQKCEQATEWEEEMLRKQEEEADCPTDWVEHQLDLQENPYPQPPDEIDVDSLRELNLNETWEHYRKGKSNGNK